MRVECFAVSMSRKNTRHIDIFLKYLLKMFLKYLPDMFLNYHGPPRSAALTIR
jgi:hypothetical protein